MTEAAEDDLWLNVRQWLVDHLAVTESEVITYPPGAVVDALAALGLVDSSNVGWSVMAHDVPSEVTNWKCTLATSDHLVELTAQAQREGGKIWTGNRTDEVDYAQQPTVSVEVRSLGDLTALTLQADGARDDAKDPRPPRQTWTFTFKGDLTRTYVVDGRSGKSSDAIEVFCRRLAASI